MHVLTIFAHPGPPGASHRILSQFRAGLEQAGHSCDTADLYAEGFDPCMSAQDMGQFAGHPLPGDVRAYQARVDRCDALCLIFPLWWYAMPAVLKGWFDRVFSPGWAYAPGDGTHTPLLRARPCTVLVPVGLHRARTAVWSGLDALAELWQVGLFEFCGLGPVDIRFFYADEDPQDRDAHVFEIGRTLQEPGRSHTR